jgi:hypothetical protein
VHILPVLYIYVKKDMLFPKVIQMTVYFVCLVMDRHQSPLQHNCAVRHGNALNTFINVSARGSGGQLKVPGVGKYLD